MFKLHITILLILANSVFSFAQYFKFDIGGVERSYLLHLPQNYNGNNKLPLIIAMHGGFGSAYNIEDQSKLSLKADAENFIVVYPEGLIGGLLKIRTWNAGVCCGASSRDNVDDVNFIDVMLDTLIGQYAIDTTRIYATGMSNGGFMSYRLACELSHRIAAIAPVACTMTMDNCSPTRPVPIIHFHSYIDESIPYLGGIGNGVSDHYNPPLDSVLNVWSAYNECKTGKEIVSDNSGYTFAKWKSCECNTKIQLYLTHDGGHSWPGGKQTAIGDMVSDYVNATNLMWDFFQQYSLDCKHLTTTKKTDEIEIQFYPNPINNCFTIDLGKVLSGKTEVTLFNCAGKALKTCAFENGESCYELDLSEYTNGIYLLQLKSDEINISRKIIKQ